VLNPTSINEDTVTVVKTLESVKHQLEEDTTSDESDELEFEDEDESDDEDEDESDDEDEEEDE
jgi:hypothetical protein